MDGKEKCWMTSFLKIAYPESRPLWLQALSGYTWRALLPWRSPALRHISSLGDDVAWWSVHTGHNIKPLLTHMGSLPFAFLDIYTIGTTVHIYEIINRKMTSHEPKLSIPYIGMRRVPMYQCQGGIFYELNTCNVIYILMWEWVQSFKGLWGGGAELCVCQYVWCWWAQIVNFQDSLSHFGYWIHSYNIHISIICTWNKTIQA